MCVSRLRDGDSKRFRFSIIILMTLVTQLFWSFFLSSFLYKIKAVWKNPGPGNHLITKILLELKSFPLNHDVVLQWNKEWLVLFTIRASVELEITDFAIIVKIIKVIFIYWRNHLFSFLPPTFYLLLTRLAEWRECCIKKKNIHQ